MKKLTVTIALLALLAPLAATAQNLTSDQKESDFRFLASLYATYYAPYEWKKTLLGFDALNVQSWVDRAVATKTDLDFYEVCVEYVASLNDTHDHFTLPSDFNARLPITADVYEGKVLIETVDRTKLPSTTFPFTTGDEVVSVDGRSVEQLQSEFAKYAAWANPIATRRLATSRIFSRSQSLMPHAIDVGDTASVVVRRQDGTLETYTLPWTKTGTPLEVGPLAKKPSPKVETSSTPEYMRLLEETQHSGVTEEGVTSLGGRSPLFVSGIGTTFTRRLGGFSGDFFYSGTFKYGDLTIGYIRIPNYAPSSTSTQSQIFQGEIDYFNANTDGLIVDEMHNSGGSLCFGEDLATRLIPYPFEATGYQLRAYWTRMLSFYNSYQSAITAGASPDVIAQYKLIYEAMAAANASLRGLTDPLPICTYTLTRTPATDANGQIIAYRKPVMMLIDEFTVSTADSMANMIQSAGRGPLFGMRTNGAGGNNTTFAAGPYTEGTAGMTLALQTRKQAYAPFGYPSSIYIENVGVHPEIVVDYMTKENLLQNGAPFVKSFLSAMSSVIRPGNGRRRPTTH